MDNMKKHRGLIISLLMLPAVLLFIILYSNAQYTKANTPVIRAGFLDLQKWDKENNPTLRLSGEWELYPNLLLNRDNIQTKHADADSNIVQLPFEKEDIWGQPLPEFTFATYQIHVINAPADQQLGISIGQLTAAYRIYADDQLIATSGQITDNLMASISDYRFQTIPLPAGKSSFDIILQTANQHDTRGFIQWPLQFGIYNELTIDDRFFSVLNLLTIGSLLTMSFLILFFSLIVPWKKELLILGAFGMVTLIQVIVTRQVLITDWFPQMSLALFNKVHYIASYAIWFFMPASLAAIYPGIFPRWFLRPALIFPLVLIMGVALSPSINPINLEWPDYINMLEYFGISFFLAKAVLNKRPGAYVIFILVSCGVALVVVYAATGDSSLIYNLATGSGLIFGSMIITECIIVSRNYIEARQLELTALRDQIRPHFVHNALAAVISISRTDPDRSRALLQNFSTYLRGRFDNTSRELISIEQELEIVEAYVALEQARYGDRFQVEYQIEANNLMLPPLILQPLVENALIHGLESKISGLKVMVYTQLQNNRVIVGVQDNGPGIANGASRVGRKGVALYNINRRLTKLYGTQLTYINGETGGSNVYMDIPYKEARLQ